MAVNRESEYLHGIPMTDEMFEHVIGMESPYRYELIDGVVYDMTGSSPEHGTIATNISLLLTQQSRKRSSCRVYQDQYVAIPGNPSVVPDVVLTCDLSDWDKSKRLKPFKIQCPLIVVEVLSPSNLRKQILAKLREYFDKGVRMVWVISPKNRKDLRDIEVIAAGKAAGMVDVKVARFSESHTALKFVVPKAERRVRDY